MPRADVVVIGAGLAGLSCAAELAAGGARVFLAAKGYASTHWTHGGTDVAAPAGARTPREGVATLAAIDGHPYGWLDGALDAAIAAHRVRLDTAGIGLVGTLDDPLVPIPTAIGTLRPAAILPAAQAAALEPWGDDGLLLVGFGRYRDAWASYAARNLRASAWEGGPGEIRALEVDLPDLAELHNLNARSLALRFDDPAWRTRALATISARIPPGAWRVGLPAVLGSAAHLAVLEQARSTLGHEVIELPSLPPSVPGLRLATALERQIMGSGGRVQVGFDVVEVERDRRRIVAIHTEAASRTLRLAADTFVLATGGIGGAGIRAHPDGTLEERVFGLPVEAPPRDGWFSDDPLVPHPLEAAGIRVDDLHRPIGQDRMPLLDNVRVIGSALAGMRYLAERCGDGVALASAHHVASSLARSAVAA
jgi:glycerol-3-phosphate dehydrogenase subunit B